MDATTQVSHPIKHSHSLTRWLCYALLACCLVPFFTSCASQRTIVNALDEKEANEILVFLSGKGIEATKVQNTEAGGATGGTKVVVWDIKVSEQQATEAMYLLNQSGLPRRRGQNLLNIFAGGGLVPSELQEKIRYQAGLAEQIASTIRKIDGVLDAEVQISFPEEDPLKPANEQKKKITASVYVKHSGVLDDPNSHLIPKIKRLVASSITGLDYDNVTVIGDRARMASPMLIGTAAEEEKQYASIWTIVLAKESVTRFRIIFFSFVLLILLLLLTMIWLAWKLLPLLQRHGGVKELFHIHPIPLEPIEKKEESKEKEKEKEETEKALKVQDESQQGLVDQEIDEET